LPSNERNNTPLQWGNHIVINQLIEVQSGSLIEFETLKHSYLWNYEKISVVMSVYKNKSVFSKEAVDSITSDISTF
jgi:hypothetical protein